MTNNLGRRLNQHNLKQVQSTKNYSPFKLIFNKEFEDRNKARDFEKYLKIHSNKEKVLRNLNYL